MDKILIVVDMQNDFITGPLGSKEAAAAVERVAEKIQSYAMEKNRIFCTMDTHSENYLQTQEGKRLPVPHCIKPGPGWELNGRIREVLRKSGMEIEYVEKQTFGSEKLIDLLRNVVQAETELEFVGVCTDICVVSNALLAKAAFPENKIIVDAACCAGVTAKTHESALETMKMCQIEVVR